MKKTVFLTVICCCLLTLVQGQSRQSDVTALLKKTNNFIQTIQSLKGELQLQITTNEPNADFLIINFTIDFSMQRQPQDSIMGWNFGSQLTDLIAANRVSYDYYHKGNNYYFNENKWWKGDLQSAKSSFLFSVINRDLFKCIKEWLDGKTLSAEEYKKQYGFPFRWEIIQSQDTVVDGKQCFVVIGTSSIKQSSGEINTRGVKMAIQKKRFVPLLSEYFSESRDKMGKVISAQKGKTYFKKLTINPIISEKELIPPIDTSTIPVYQIPSQSNMLAVGDYAPKWKLFDVNGKHYCSEELDGKVCFVLFSTSTCGWCVFNNKRVKEAYEELKERKDLAFILINPVDQGEQAKQYAKGGQYQFPVLVDNGSLIADLFGVKAYPASFIIGKDGVIRQRFQGYSDAFTKEVFLEAILKVLNEPKTIKN